MDQAKSGHIHSCLLKEEGRRFLQDGRRADFSESLRALLFNDDLSNEPTFSQIHLAGQLYL